MSTSILTKILIKSTQIHWITRTISYIDESVENFTQFTGNASEMGDTFEFMNVRLVPALSVRVEPCLFHWHVDPQQYKLHSPL